MPSFSTGSSVSLQFVADSDGDAFDTLREYVRYSNDSTTNTGTDIRGKPWYHESPHPSADFSSALVRLEPGGSVGDVRDWWAIITEASITTNSVGTARRITLELFVLAEGDEYDDCEFVENEFEAGL
ncbi:hypothetical protein AArcSl_1278 [Halalkaliarchaeum desulfuricum]|uniref:Uncharacterized protein n=2 Tax=Halalkaliarchaeum desulfuricum TaxID=2055893 RepID=A0A343TII7_9EURY|nr:hypothetical protein AArcSl_1278 [Halalkaliarchaeum desulfuricum]